MDQDQACRKFTEYSAGRLCLLKIWRGGPCTPASLSTTPTEWLRLPRLKTTMQLSPLISYPSYDLLNVNALQAVGNVLDSGVGLPHLWVHLRRWQEQQCQHFQELRGRVSWLSHDWIMTGLISINHFSAMNFQHTNSSNQFLAIISNNQFSAINFKQPISSN